MTEIAVADIGGTNARFAIAEVAAGRVTSLGEPVTLHTGQYANLQSAWEAFGRQLGRPLPKAAGIAVASPVTGETLSMPNSPWTIRTASLPHLLGLDHLTLLNDFGAVAHAVTQLQPDQIRHLCGPTGPLPTSGVITILGPGTGLGVAQLLRRDGRNMVIETESGHIDFAPLDSLEDQILGFLRTRYRRVSVERVVSGPGLANLYEALGALQGQAVQLGDDAALWAAALDGGDSLATAALDRFCLSLGAFAGDVALAHGAGAVMLAGGLAQRFADHLGRSGFHARFIAKGRFEARLAKLPVSLITHPQPGLLGAAAAYASEHET